MKISGPTTDAEADALIRAFLMPPAVLPNVTIPSEFQPGVTKVESLSSPGTFYFVDEAAQSCSCPQFVHRLAGTGRCCKHLNKARSR